jgi:hypothetical protein
MVILIVGFIIIGLCLINDFEQRHAEDDESNDLNNPFYEDFEKHPY